MTKPDPDPTPRLSMLWRIRRFVKWLALLSVAIALIAVVLGMRGDRALQGQMVIATALAIGLTVLLGTGVMILTFMNSPTGRYPRDKDK